MFKIYSYCYINTCRSLELRLFKNPLYCFLSESMFFLLVSEYNTFCRKICPEKQPLIFYLFDELITLNIYFKRQTNYTVTQWTLIGIKIRGSPIPVLVSSWQQLSLIQIFTIQEQPPQNTYFTGKHPCQSLIFNFDLIKKNKLQACNFIKNEAPARVLLWNFWSF